MSAFDLVHLRSEQDPRHFAALARGMTNEELELMAEAMQAERFRRLPNVPDRSVRQQSPDGPEVFVGGRRSGKTRSMLRWLQEDPRRVLVEPNESMAEHARREYRYGEPTYTPRDDFRILSGGRDVVLALRGKVVEVGVDNAEMMLERLFPVLPVGRLAVNGRSVQ